MEKNIDILFVGNIWMSEKRKEMLEMLVRHYPNLNLQYYGKYKPIEKGIFAWLFRNNRHVFKNRNISPQKVNELYSRCKIALNIHNEQTTYGANQRVFEICGAAAYQICDANPFIEQLFPNGEVGLYHNEQELIALINDALKNDKSENARKAWEYILAEHTFLHRIKTMLKNI
jgi:spore maturation protein CgeB